MAEAVFFDVGNTLLFPNPSVPETFSEIARSFGHDVSAREVAVHMPAVDAFYEEEYLRDGDFWCSHDRATGIWYDMYRILCDRVGIDYDSERVVPAVHEAYRTGERWGVYDDVFECLKTLKLHGMKLGVVSNWDAGLEGILRDLGMLPYFDIVVSSAVVGYRKPDSIIFEIACEQIGSAALDVVHVGDLPEADGCGAANAGIHPFIIDRAGVHASCGFDCSRSLVEIARKVCDAG